MLADAPQAARRLALVLAALASIACPRRSPGEQPPRELGEAGPTPEQASEAAEPPDAHEPFEPFEPPRECESLCGAMHDCLLAESVPDFPALAPHQAGALEIDCLGHCIAGDATLATSRFSSCASSTTCDALLPCMRTNWPQQPTPPSEPELTPSPSGSGCRDGCKRLGECFDAGQPMIDDCTQGCEDKLDADDEAAFGECTRSADCLLMLECMRKFPGA